MFSDDFKASITILSIIVAHTKDFPNRSIFLYLVSQYLSICYKMTLKTQSCKQSSTNYTQVHLVYLV